MVDRLIGWPRPEETAQLGGPPFRDDELDAWVVSAYADADEVVRDAGRFASARVFGPSRPPDALAQTVAGDPRADVAGIYFRMAFISSDGDKHRREHDFVVKAFTPRRVRAMEPFIRELSEQLTAAMLGRRQVEFVEEFAVPLPVQVIAHWFGLPREDFGDFKRWSDGFEGLTGAPTPTTELLDAFLTAAVEFTDYAIPLIEQRRRAPKEDFISALTLPHEKWAPLSNEEILSMCSSLLLAGSQTSTAALAGTLLYLVRTPGLQEQVRLAPELIPAVVEEGLRLTTPSQGLFRTATVDTTVGGVDVAEGEHLFLYYSAANRDPARFQQPLVPRLDRPDKRHLSFGRGPHVCLGAPIARAELQIGLETLLARTATITLSDEENGVVPFGNLITARVGELLLDFEAARPASATR